ncbi:MAG: oligosaccharide flippase family protein [Candidatus Kapabacteria bacterium]|nr:oligosaccharide flippase family protein [Candidatus Kapabacteria bacterium]
MKISNFLDKITWSIADKGLFVGYGLVQIVQMNMMTPAEFGLFALLISIHTWIFVVSDAVSLQNIIQFGTNKERAPKANFYSLCLHLAIVLVLPMYFFLLREPISIICGVEELTYIFSILPIFCLATTVRTYCIKFVFKHVKMNHLFLINLALFLPMTLITLYFLYIDGSLCLERMVLMYLCGHTISSIIAFLLTRKNIKISTKGSLRLSEVLNFSFPLLCTNALQALPKQLDSYLVSFFFGTSVTGIYYSAKTLFRVFEEALAAAQGLVYPAAVRRIEAHDYTGLKEIISKSVSFLFFAFAGILLFLQTGVSDWLISTFLNEKFISATGQFNLLSFAALGLPFYIFSSLLVAEKKPKILFRFVLVSVCCFITTFCIVGYIGNSNYIALSYISYNFALGITCTGYYLKNRDYKLSDIFRTISDLIYALKK